MLGDREIGRLDDVEPDMPWYSARFTPGEAFPEVEPLLKRDLAITESAHGFDADAWQATWEELWGMGLHLQLDDGVRVDRDFAVHIYEDGAARFRY